MVYFRFVKLDVDGIPDPIPADETCIYPYGFYVFTVGGMHTFLDMIKGKAPADDNVYEVHTSDGCLAYKKGDKGYKFLIKNKQFLLV